MYRYKRLLVGVSFAQQDGASIRYAAMISRLAKSEKIIFLHVASHIDMPEDLLKEYPNLFQPVNEYAKEEMEALVSKHFDGHPDTKIEYEVAEGSPLMEFLRRAKEEDIDLIVMRKRKEPTVSGSLFEKIARKAPCSVLFVPEGSKAWYENILVPQISRKTQLTQWTQLLTLHQPLPRYKQSTAFMSTMYPLVITKPARVTRNSLR